MHVRLLLSGLGYRLLIRQLLIMYSHILVLSEQVASTRSNNLSTDWTRYKRHTFGRVEIAGCTKSTIALCLLDTDLH